MCCGVAKGVWRLVKDGDEQNHQQHNEQIGEHGCFFALVGLFVLPEIGVAVAGHIWHLRWPVGGSGLLGCVVGLLYGGFWVVLLWCSVGVEAVSAHGAEVTYTVELCAAKTTVVHGALLRGFGCGVDVLPGVAASADVWLCWVAHEFR